MFPRHRANAHAEDAARPDGNARQPPKKIACRGYGRGPARFDIERKTQEAHRLSLIEPLLTPFHAGDEVAALLPSVADAAEDVQLDRRVDHSGNDEDEHDRWCDEQQFTVETH